MAPDLNSVPSSPRQQRLRMSQPSSTASSRRPSQAMPAAATAHGASMTSPEAGMPVRHPRPLTAAELHLELEKEQEAVVNRLTRELSSLRAQNSASAASNTSVSSNEQSDAQYPSTGSTHPTPSRRHRSSSSISSRSITTSTSATTNPAQPQSQSQSQSQASAARSLAAGTISSTTPSRRPSTTLMSDLPSRPLLPHTSSHTSLSSTQATLGSSTNLSLNPHQQHASCPHAGSSSMASISGTVQPNWAEAERAKTELETVRAENDALRQRIRALEGALRERRRQSSVSGASETSTAGGGSRVSAGGRESSLTRVSSVGAWAAGMGGGVGVAGPRERSESQSTTASSRRATGQLGGAEDRDEVVRVGESAGNAGMR